MKKYWYTLLLAFSFLYQPSYLHYPPPFTALLPLSSSGYVAMVRK